MSALPPVEREREREREREGEREHERKVEDDLVFEVGQCILVLGRMLGWFRVSQSPKGIKSLDFVRVYGGCIGILAGSSNFKIFAGVWVRQRL